MAVKRTFGSSFIKEKKALHKFKVKYEQESEWLKGKTLLDAKRKRRVPDTLTKTRISWQSSLLFLFQIKYS